MQERHFLIQDLAAAPIDGDTRALLESAVVTPGAALDALESERPSAAHVRQLREANQRLVLATLHALELAEEAERARAQVAHDELRFHSLVDSIAAIVWSADERGWIRFDPRWHVLTGLSTSEPQGPLDWLEGVHAGDRERVRLAWTSAVANRTIYECEHRVVRHDGAIVWVEARAVPLRGEHEHVREWTGLMADITHRKLLEEARERFVGVLGHDLRTPLTAIKMGADQLASTDELAPGQRGTIALIRRCVGRMQSMIVDVLDFTRGRLGGGIPLTLRLSHFGHVCRDTVSELRAVHPDRRILLDMAGELRGEWDVGRVQQVVANLVGNAIEHGADPIQVTVSGEGDEVKLEIRNANLVGAIAPELLPLLFEPFRRGAPGDDSGGLGLGLYIVSEIMRAHGGGISASSSAAETTFTSRWPRRRPRSPFAPDTSLLTEYGDHR